MVQNGTFQWPWRPRAEKTASPQSGPPSLSSFRPLRSGLRPTPRTSSASGVRLPDYGRLLCATQNPGSDSSPVRLFPISR